MLKKSYLFYAVIALAVAGGLMLMAYPRPQKGGKQAPATTSEAGENKFDFGMVRINGGDVSHLYKIKNTTGSLMTITKLSTSCMCTKAFLLSGGRRLGPFGMPGHSGSGGPTISQTLQPGQTAEVEAVFDPAAHGPAGLGKVDRVVSIETAEGQATQLQFSAEVIP